MRTAQALWKYTDDRSEQILLTQILERSVRAVHSGACLFSSFLSPAERALLLRVPELQSNVQLAFDGGYPDAERTVAVLCPHDMVPLPATITALSVTCKGSLPTHRDLLGALMALRIKRDKIGDILLSEEKALFFCDTAIAPYLCDNLLLAGHSHLYVCRAERVEIPALKVECKTFTVASARLDAITANGFALSRQDSAQAIRKGLVFVNWRQVLSPAKELAAGDRVSLRGFGKIRISRFGGQSRKGRLFVEVECYR